MTETPSDNPADNTDAPTSPDPDTSTAAKDPAEWVTGDEPATGSQLSYLGTLAQDSGTAVPENLTKADASKLIDELRGASPRVNDEPA
jgi:hypothetical protein